MGFSLSNIFQGAAKTVTVIHPDFHLPENINRDFNQDRDTITSMLTCEKVLSEAIGKLPLEIYKTSKEEGTAKAKDHILYRLLHNSPNNYQTSTLFFQQLEKWRNHYGNAFAKIHRDATGKAESLEHIHPKDIVGYSIQKGKLYFARSIEGQEEAEIINNDDLLHFRFLSDDGVLGLNPGKVLINELTNIFQGKETLNASYRNQLSIDRVIETDIKNFGTKPAQETVKAFKQEYTGSANNGKVPVLPEGFKVVALPKISIQDGQILESLNYSAKEIYAFYGVPFPENKSYNSLEQQALDFKINTLQPICRQYRQELQAKLLTDQEIQEGFSIEFNLNSLMEADLKTRTEYYRALHQMAVIDSNTIAKMEGFETYEGGEKHFIQSQYVPVEQYEEFAKNKPGQQLTNTES